ncbi:MAG: CHASE2 domain-containing protein [Burkholderiales bacterium]
MSAARRLATFAAVVLALAAFEAFGPRLLAPLENRLLDAFVRSHARNLVPDADIVLVDIDDASLARMQSEAGKWPWPRVVHAQLVDGIAAQRPRAIVFDIVFSEPDVFRKELDQAFADAIAPHRNIYFPLVRLPAHNDAKFPPLSTLADALGLKALPGADPAARAALVPPLALPESAWRAGTIGFENDGDGVGRRCRLREIVGGWEIPSLPARIARDLGWPLPDADEIVLAWRGPVGAMRHVPYADLYEDFNRSAKRRPADEFRGKIVIVGTAATALQDLRVTPMSSLHPGAEILASALENLKNGRTMRYAPAWLAWLLAAGLVAALYAAFARKLDASRTALALAIASAALLAAAWAAVGRLLLVPVLAPLVAAWGFYFAAATAAYLREKRERQEAIAMFSRFVNPHVVKQLVERGGLDGAGQTRQVTLLFSDIRGFTTLSETRSPEEVVALLNRYFSLQVDVVFKHGGALDKFIGDAIMALWGAPLDDPEHAKNAVLCALEMADTLQQFKREIGARVENFDVGIGIHSGPALVGLIGSDKRREYTAIGDTVNLASRIEGLTKEAGRRILVSADTAQLCGDAIDFTSCGSYKVKGRAQAVELFEPRRKP